MSFPDILLLIAAFVAGAQNALAGGGSFLTFPALLYAGFDPRAANITSTLGLFPCQVTTSLSGLNMVEGAAGLSLRTLFITSVVGGAIGAVLLLETPVSVFTHLVPYLVLFATVVFAWGSFFAKKRTKDAPPRISPRGALIAQVLISIYGGYFGGGIGILMLAALTAAGLSVRHAGATKNVLAGVINVAAVVIFILRTHQNWWIIVPFAISAIIGGQIGVYMLRRLNEKVLRVGITAIGALLTIGLFLHP
ncbi:MAG: sulfite exporter TauE/SafE family protein [Geothrix sp.]|nr:sulfite exporter TauE/SafE family protein [Geothrix sp.]